MSRCELVCHTDTCLCTQVGTPQQLRELVTLGCHVLHYTGHGMAEGLAFEDEVGQLNILDVDTLGAIFRAGGVDTKVRLMTTSSTSKTQLEGFHTHIRSPVRRGQLVFVSACHSENAGNAFVQVNPALCIMTSDLTMTFVLRRVSLM